MLSTSSSHPIVSFGSVVRCVNLTESNPKINGIDRIIGLDNLSSENLHIKSWGSIDSGTSFTRKFMPGQTLFGKRRAYQRKVAFAEFSGLCSGDILTFESTNHNILLPELLPFICMSNSFYDYAIKTSAGSLSPRTSWTALSNFKFILPPLDEQKRLADLLWAADEVVERIMEVGRDIELNRNALYNRYFQLGSIPMVPLHTVGRVNMGQSPESKFCGANVEGLPFFQGCTDFGEMYPQTSTYCSRPRKTALKNDILISVRAPVGVVNIAIEDCCIGRGIAAITPIQVPGIYLFHALKANASKLSQYEQGSTFKAINKNELLNFEIAFIDKTTTNEVTKTLEMLDAATNNLRKHLSDSRRLLSSLINNRIHGDTDV